MNIAVIIGRFPPVFGGQTPVEIEIHGELLKRGHTVIFLTPKYDKSHAEYEKYEGINILRVNPPLKNPFFELLFVHNAFTKIKEMKFAPDIILDLIPFGNSMLITRIYSKLWNIPVVCKLSQEGSNEPLAARKGKFGFFRKKLFNTYQKIIAISPILVENSILAGIPENRIELIPNCVNTDLFTPVDDDEKNKLRMQLLPHVNGNIVMVVGNVSPRKQSHFAVEVWNLLKSNFSESTTLAFVGPIKSTGHPFDQQYVDQLRQKIQQYNLKDSVIFTGFRKNIHEYFQASDITLFVSKREGLGMVVLESMSVGVPIVTVKLDKISEYLLSNGKEGYITSENPSEIVERLVTLLCNSDLRKSMGQNGRKNVVERFSVLLISEEIEKQYEDAINCM